MERRSSQAIHRTIFRTEGQVPFLAHGQHETFEVAFAVPIGETSFNLYWEPQFQPPKVRVSFGP